MAVSLRSIRLRHIAVFDHLMVDAQPGFQVVLGEAGSGKSLFLQALDWALGGSVKSAEVLRAGCQQGLIELELAIPQGYRAFWQTLEEQSLLSLIALDLELEEAVLRDQQPAFTLTLTREFTPTQSRCRLQGQAISKPAVLALRPCLLDYQSQHAAVALFDAGVQFQYLESLGDVAYQTLKENAQQAYSHWKQLHEQYDSRQTFLEKARLQQAQLEEELELFRRIDPREPEEDTLLRQEISALSQGEDLVLALSKSLACLQGASEDTQLGQSVGLLDGFNALTRSLRKAVGLYGPLEPVLEKAESLQEELRLLAQGIEAKQETFEPNPQRLEVLQDRLSQLDKLKRRFGEPLPQLLPLWESKEQALLKLVEQTAQSPEALKADLEKALQVATQQLQHLTQARCNLAHQLQELVQAQLEKLALPHARFDIVVEAAPWSLTRGADQITYRFSANPGEPLRPLDKVASGGELSRLLLALKVACFQSRQVEVPTKKDSAGRVTPMFVFDEIDTGTSGMAAQAMARQLQQLSQQVGQLWVISHQPLMAAHGTHWLSFAKQVQADSQDEARAHSSAQWLTTPQEKQKALALLAAGDQAASQEETLVFAQSLLEQAHPKAG
jgi:DNA repair protein RecN (Recombination protein N)